MAATVATQKVTALGPIKMEVVHLTGVTTGDTFRCLIQNGLFCLASEQGAAAASTVQASVVASTKTVTVTNQTAAGGAGDITVLVFGF